VVGGEYVEPAWSNDGRSLYFVDISPGHSLFEVGIRGGPIINVADLGCAVSHPAISISGRIAVTLGCAGSNRIEVLNADGKGHAPVPGTSGARSGPGWSPDGSRLVFEKGTAIQTIGADGQRVRTLHTGLRATDPSYSPDGTKILFSDVADRSDGRDGVYTMNLDGSGLRRLAALRFGVRASWQPVPTGGTPSSSPSTTATGETPTPTPIPSPSPTQTCPTTSATADFDGDGTADTATVTATTCGPEGTNATWSISVIWGNGPSGTWGLAECPDTSCAAVGSIPMNDGSNALVLRTHEGASTVFYELLNLFPSEAGPHEYGVVDPGAPGFPAGQTAEFPDEGSVTHEAFLRCQGGSYPGGGDQATIVETTADLSHDGSTYTVVETILAHGPNVGQPELIVVAQTSKDVAFDSFDPAKDVTGAPCWSQGGGSPSPSASPSPSPSPSPSS
jgi:WD40-like Beta Propeller Repeat